MKTSYLDKKVKHLSEISQETEKNRSQGSVGYFFKTIQQYKSLNPSLSVIKTRNNDLLMILEEKAERRIEYFIELMNTDISGNPTRRKNLRGAYPIVSEVTREETNNWPTS